jgi:hypothetical protein
VPKISEGVTVRSVIRQSGTANREDLCSPVFVVKVAASGDEGRKQEKRGSESKSSRDTPGDS